MGAWFDEMFDVDGQPRPAYRALAARLLELPADDLRRRQREADDAFLQQGITFTVYGDEEGTERIFPVRSAAAHHHRAPNGARSSAASRSG